jgi:hypothetical protein
MSDEPSLCTFYDAKPKILIRRVINRQDRLMCTFSEEKLVFKKDINPFILHSADKEETLFLTGVLNSKLVSYLYINTSSIATKDDFRQTTLAELRRLPVPGIENTKGGQGYKKMVASVSSLIDLNRRLTAARMDQEKTSILRQIDGTDRLIDEIVYELYELSRDERNVVEGGE